MNPDLYHAAACRLVSQTSGSVEQAARRLVAASGAHGIDLSLVWGTVEYRPGKRPTVRQACLAVLGAGKTAMIFVSEPPRIGDAGGSAAGIAERVSCIRTACSHFANDSARPVRIAQSLPDQKEPWACQSLLGAGFTKVGDLTYMKRAGVGAVASEPPPLGLGAGIGVLTFEALVREAGEAAALAAVVTALDRSYVGTLDCPELCGLRDTTDVVQSHRATGKFDPRLWWVVRVNGKPEGCLLLNPCPEMRSVELVYLGLSPELRGQGFAKRLLTWGLSHAAVGSGGRANWDVSCAVDDRNEPAQRLYRGLGFRAGARRVALVKPI